MLAGYVQFKPIFGERERNLKRALNLLEDSAHRGAELMVLPELFNTGYVFRNKRELERLAEIIHNGRTQKALSSFAEENGLHVCAGMCESHGGKFYNSALLVGPNGRCDTYRKTHLFAEEKLWFEPGNTGFRTFAVKGTRVGIIICFDWFFPEAIRSLALRGAELVLQPANLVLPYCQTAMLGMAVQNRVFIITANRIGAERGLTFTGGSQIVGPDMKVLARSGLREDVKVVEVDPVRARDKKITRYNNIFKDRRPRFYSAICSG